MSDATCGSCQKKLIVNFPTECGAFVSYTHGYIGHPMCQACLDEYDRQMCPTVTRFQRLVYEILRPHHRHVNTGGFDPYAGEEWSFELLGTEVELSSVILFKVSIGRREFHEGWSGYYGGRIWRRPLRYWKYRFLHVPDYIAQYLGRCLFELFEQVRYADYVEDPYGSLAYYE